MEHQTVEVLFEVQPFMDDQLMGPRAAIREHHSLQFRLGLEGALHPCMAPQRVRKFRHVVVPVLSTSEFANLMT